LVAPRILHIISGLDTGGAEMMLYKLLVEFSRQGVQSEVISIRKLGPMAEKIEQAGISVHTLNLGLGLRHAAFSVPLLIWKTRHFAPSVIQGWMYHGNLFATISSLFMSRQVLLCWNIRQTLYDIKKEKRLTAWTIWIGKHLSKRPSHILYNSNLSAHQHEKYGYSARQTTVVFNGFDLGEFKPDSRSRIGVRRELNIRTRYVVGHIARFHPKKDHQTFLKATRVIVDEIEDVTFVMVGRGVALSNTTLATYVKECNLGDKMCLLGERLDISRLMTAMDVVVSSSGWGEGFSNVIGEAMSSGALCVVTNVGDSKEIVGDAGIVAPPYSVEGIANGVIRLLKYSTKKRLRIGERGRQRMIQNYSIDNIALQYLQIYRR